MRSLSKINFQIIFTKSNYLLIFIFIITLSILIYPEIRILISNYINGYTTLLAQTGKDAVREDIFLYYPSYKNLILGKSFFFDGGNLNFKDIPVPFPYIPQIIGNLLTIITGGNDNISVILLRSLPLISLILLYKIFLSINFSKNESIIFAFFTLISVYETSRFPSPSITYIFFLLSIILILKSFDNPKKNILLPIICGLQTWIYFFNFVIIAPVYIYSIIIRKIFFKTDLKIILKELIIFLFIFGSYFIFTLLINNNIESSFFEKILWSRDYIEYRDYNIQTNFTGRYKISIIIISSFLISFLLLNIKNKSKLRKLLLSFKDNKFLKLHIFFIIFALIIFFPFFFQNFVNFPQPQQIFTRIGQFQILFLLCICYKILFTTISEKYFNSFFIITFKNMSLILFFFLSIFFSFKNISFIENYIDYKNKHFIFTNSEKKIVAFLNNEEKCTFATTNKKVLNLVKIQTKCRIINPNIFNSNLEISELIERYILVDFISGYNLNKVLSRFNLNKNFIPGEKKICLYYLKENYDEKISRDGHASQVLSFSKCELFSLKKKVILKYNLIAKNPKFYINKYNLKFLYQSLRDDKFNSNFFKKTKVKNLLIIKN